MFDSSIAYEGVTELVETAVTSRRPSDDERTGVDPQLRPGVAQRRWLILIHQLPPNPSNLRVRIWRRLRELGAIAVKQSVYVLPDTPATREDFEWLKVEIEGAGGSATVYTADHVDPAAETDLIDEFRTDRQRAYATLASELHKMCRANVSGKRSGRGRALTRYRARLAAIERIDFFASAGRDRVITLLGELAGAPSSPEDQVRLSGGSSENADDGAEYQARLWVTRPRPGVDRMASAWLIRRFIDQRARFGFVSDIKTAGNAVAFDMFGGGFSHEGDRCTFETLVRRFTITEPEVFRIAEIVHDLDLRDGKFNPPEAGTLGLAIEGLQLSISDDGLLLDQGMTLFEALYRSFAHGGHEPRPRGVVTPKPKATGPR